MNKFGLLVAVLLITLVSCTSGGKQETQNSDNDANQALVESNEMIDSHTSEISLDWAGVYEGTLPCADCEGIETVIELKDDHTYVAYYKYLGNPGNNKFTEKGAFTWDETGSNVTLKSENETTLFKVGENQLFMLTQDGEINTGELADFYVLNKKM